MNVRQLATAEQDIYEIGFDLESFRSGWGGAFKTEMAKAIEKISDFPRAHPRTEDGPDEPENREYYISRFEIRVIYAIWRDEAVIIALIHAKQKPDRWRHRLTELN